MAMKKKMAYIIFYLNFLKILFTRTFAFIQLPQHFIRTIYSALLKRNGSEQDRARSFLFFFFSFLVSLTAIS